jgi:hypothetical protein
LFFIGAQEGYAVCLDTKETKNQVSRNASLPHGPFTHKAEKAAGWNLFAGLPYLFATFYAKISYALPITQAGSFPRFSPKLVC